ncbi:UDP-N-acetylenolpyruvoylglucosamine reductase [Candidatus Bealeia paramacronuclearis]|uniref:UDP-N-acetylenolpyruvoylglucosamine reductase n=1 Tax=Candidatus Bealeia paramacronuclearis TaxID=1921001 RepID=A0ABZ2C0D6_9PROT|nr:UDP-N-acetylenolpyruvoylglucosamine reductase [Candidatus Bealeia paramacronuclearis]
MTSQEFQRDLLKRLPKVRGRYTVHAPLSQVTWFRVGGPAEVLYKPADLQDLQFFLSTCPLDIPVTTLGVGSNLLVRDGGVPGVVIRMGQGFNNIHIHESYIHVGAAVLDRTVAMLAQQNGIAGLEFFCGIPGTVGGALRMNAGAYGGDVSQILQKAFALDRNGKLRALNPQEIGHSYRYCDLPKDWIFVGARFLGKKDNPFVIESRMKTMLASREETQPVHSRTGGSTFANPEGLKAWELIDKAGCRGLTVGGAKMSELHCNFMINTGSASASDLERLGEEVRVRVKESSGEDLRWEIERIGIEAALKKAVAA